LRAQETENKWKVAPASLFLRGEFVFGGAPMLLGCLCARHPRARMVRLAPQFSDVLSKRRKGEWHRKKAVLQ
jgi:hypothetical protein